MPLPMLLPAMNRFTLRRYAGLVRKPGRQASPGASGYQPMPGLEPTEKFPLLLPPTKITNAGE